jgi:hypothetical protein
MDLQAIIASLDKEIARLEQARAILSTAARVKGAASIKRGPGRPKKLAAVSLTKKRVMSPEGKARIAAAQKARWAAAKKSK